MPNSPRSATPTSDLYKTIHSQPALIAEVLERLATTADAAADALAPARRVFLAGTGTSSHAAVVGEHLLRSVGVDAYATTSFDFATYPRRMDTGDALITISHRGSKQYGARAIDQARAAGMRVVGLTGRDSAMDGADVILATAPQETSSTHTASYIGSLTALAMIAVALGERRGADVDALHQATHALPATVAALLAREDEVRPAAAVLASVGRMTLFGAGPNAVTAREGALKVKESSYLTAEGFELETALHGALPAVQAGDLGVVVAAYGPALERTAALVVALRPIGARLLVVCDERAAARLREASGDAQVDLISFPATPEPLSPLPATIPLQLLAAFTADLRGTNADSFRADDPRYKRSTDSYEM